LGNLQHTEGHARFSANNSIQVLLFFRSKEKPNTVEKWKNNFRVIDNTLTLRFALVFLPTTVFGFYFPNTVQWKNGKLLSGRSYFFPRASFFHAGKFFFRGQVFFCQQQYSGFIFFRITENGGKPHWIFTPPEDIVR
jgi:hypothetical protein